MSPFAVSVECMTGVSGRHNGNINGMVSQGGPRPRGDACLGCQIGSQGGVPSHTDCCTKPVRVVRLMIRIFNIREKDTSRLIAGAFYAQWYRNTSEDRECAIDGVCL